MRPLLKHFFLKLSVALLIFICALCHHEGAQPALEAQELPARIDLSEFDEINAKGLTYVSDYLQKQKQPSGNFRQLNTSAESLAITAVDEFLKSEGVSLTDRQATAAYLAETLGKTNYYYVPNSVKLTDLQAIYLAAIELVFNEDLEFQESMEMLDHIEDQAYLELPEQELAIVIKIIHTAKIQSSFWYEHLGEFETVSSNGRVACVKSWKKVGLKSIGGAAGGAVACGIGSIFGPVGWAAWGGCIIGGAAGVAVEEVVDQCFDNTHSSDACQIYTGSSFNKYCTGTILNYGKYNVYKNPYTLLGSRFRHKNFVRPKYPSYRNNPLY